MSANPRRVGSSPSPPISVPPSLPAHRGHCQTPPCPPFWTLAPGTIRSARSVTLSTSSGVTDPISPQPQPLAGPSVPRRRPQPPLAKTTTKRRLAGEAMPRHTSRNLSQAPSLGPAFEHKHESPITLSAVPDRGACKGRGTTATSRTSPSSAHDVTLDACTSLSSACPRDLPHFTTLGHSSVRHSGLSSSSVS
ncbi:hypothetical protein BD309DRAFT_963793 [Dichomitus squalens]|uniref:Uncharacterized protein n=1 Tax=Dichomitus squalens TaxID=114155 RepID=A0A4Q9NRU7_9APHY|nr:hypothetical protein BD309DRAFT_963793 [Dichomitus squalens]TBU55185.1 hypothetical protein BD310DRAFT_934190 [Dichomitus squalens]